MEIFSLTGVLTNDVDADGDSLVAILDTPPKNGILDLQGSGAFDYTANNCAVDDQFTYRVTDGQNESNAARVFLNAPGIPEAVPWYPVFCWDSIPKANTSSPYAWYHVQVIADETPDIPFFATNVQGDSLNDREYFLANFSGFPPGSYTAGYRYWHPAEDQYGDFLPLAIKNAGKGDSWVLTYPEADEPSSLTIETCDPGIYLLSFIVGNAQGYEVKVEGMDGDFSRVWRHIFIPGENTDRVQCVLGGNTMFKSLRLARIPVDDVTTLKVDLTIPGTYEVSVRGFNPKDEQEGLPEYKVFSDLIVVDGEEGPRPLPLQPTGLLPKNGDVITIPELGIEIAHRLQWDPITSANSYIIYLTEIDASPILNFTNVGDRTSYDVPLRAGSYTWQIAAINEDQGENIIGPWSESQHFEVIRDIIAPVIINDIIQGNGTTVMLEWAPDGAIPVEVEVYHFYAGLEVWDTLPPMPLTSIDRENRVGTLDLGETMNEPGTHFFMIRGINEQGDIGKFKYFSLEN